MSRFYRELSRKGGRMVRPADEEHDVICHQCRKLDGRDVWTVWVAGEKQGERDTLEAASQLTRDVAATCSRAAWLVYRPSLTLR